MKKQSKKFHIFITDKICISHLPGGAIDRNDWSSKYKGYFKTFEKTKYHQLNN